MSDTLLSTTVAGVNASIVESILTFPLEYTKTRQQLFKGSSKSFELPELGRAYFRGCSPLIVGNALRATVRFSTYNWATKFMSDGQGTTSAPQIAAAGMLTGLFESFVVVPFESIKTTMIERGSVQTGSTSTTAAYKSPERQTTVNQIKSGPNVGVKSGTSETKNEKPRTSEIKASTVKKAHSSDPRATPLRTHASTSSAAESQATSVKSARSSPSSVRPIIRPPAHAVTHGRYVLYPNDLLYGLSANCRAVYNERGLRSFIQGFWPTLSRQLANSVVKFSCYNFLKQAFHPSDTEPVPSWLSLTLGCVTGAIQVFATQPIDVVKTRMQSVNGLPIYRNSLFCSYLIFTQEGPRKLWAGLIPRFIKVSFSGGIVFTVYEATNSLMNKAMKERPFDWK